MFESNHATPAATPPPDAASLLTTLANDLIKECRAARRWRIFFRLLVLGLVIGVVVAQWRSEVAVVSTAHTAIVEIDGIIGANEISARHINRSLVDAFSATATRGVIVQINSPGGAPVQAAQINEEITRLKKLYPDKPVYAVITDLCASGGYYIAVAADQIYAHRASVVGSIGVVMDGFGFTGTMEKLGIDRRLITAGANKGLLDPFSPLAADEVAHIETILREVHTVFIDAVKAGRGERLSNDPEIFSGLFWSGSQAIRLGLIDHFGSSAMIARDLIGAAPIVDYTHRPDFIQIFTDRISTAWSAALTGAMHENWRPPAISLR